jgi:uncharacterized delta-60 repeat protein
MTNASFVSFGGVETAPAVEGVVGNDSDPEGDSLTAILVSGPTNAAAFNLNADGTFSYTPTADFSGVDSFSYKANDGSGDSNVVVATITVNAINDDPTFFGPGDGSVTTNVAGSTDYGYSVTVQPDGKSLVGGYSWTGSSYDFVVTRYNTDGSLDTTFGGGDGVATIDIDSGGNDLGYSLTVQPDGKILFAGAGYNGVDRDFALTRLNGDGSMDTSFGGGDGIVTTDIAADNDLGKSVVLQPDGKIVVAGFSRVGVNNNFAVIRYNSDGSLDTSFDGDGIVTTAVPIFSSHIDDVALQADGKIVVIGDAQDGSGSDFAVVRYNTDGSLDTSFGGTGIVITAVGTTSSPQSIVVQADGKILAGGSTYNGTDYDFAVVRYNTDGTLDTSFGGGDGIATIALGSGDDSAYDMVVQPDGKILDPSIGDFRQRYR